MGRELSHSLVLFGLVSLTVRFSFCLFTGLNIRFVFYILIVLIYVNNSNLVQFVHKELVGSKRDISVFYKGLKVVPVRIGNKNQCTKPLLYPFSSI